MQCPKCQHENASDARFCDECGAPIATSCPDCGTDNRPGARFCKQCGTSLQASRSVTSFVQSISQQDESEKRFQTLLWAVMWWLQRERRVTYRTLKHILSLDETQLEEIRRELAFKEMTIDKDGEGLAWIGETQLPAYPVVPTPSPLASAETATDTSPVTPLIPSHHIEAGTPSNGPTPSTEILLHRLPARRNSDHL